MRNRVILALAFSFFPLVPGTGGVMAQTNPEPDQNPTSNMGALKGQIETAGSYSAHSGNATRSITDLSVPGALGDYGLNLVRYWNSLRNDRYEANSTMEPDQRTDFGSPGWSHSWAWVAYYAEDSPVVEDGQEEIYTTSITITFPDGHASKYKITRSNRRHPPLTGWDPDPRCGAPYYANHGENSWVGPGGGVGDHLMDMTENGSSFWLYRADGGSVHFQDINGDYQATEIFDPHGLRTELHYDADGYLEWVEQDGGRRLTFRWDDYCQGVGQCRPKVIGRVTSSSSGSAGTQFVDYRYSWFGSALTLSSVIYQNDPAPGQTATAVYTYGNYTPPEGFSHGGPLLVTAKDPRYAGPMQYIRYDYALTGCLPTGRPQNPHTPYQNARRDDFYASPTSVVAERDGKTGAYVSRFGIGCFDGTRTEQNGFNGFRKFYYGHSATWPQSGARGHELAKVTDFYTGGNEAGADSRRQSYLNGHPRQSWDGRGIATEFEHTDGTGLPSQIKHVSSDNSTFRWNRANPGNSEPRDPNRVPNPHDRWLFSKTDENNQTTTYTRDARRRVKRIDHPGGSFEEFQYDNNLPNGFNQVTSHRLASGAIVTCQYNGRGLLEREWNDVEGYAARKEYTYDSLDRVLTMTDGFARQHGKDFSTKTTYNGRHQPLTIEYAGMNNSPNNPKVTCEYDSWGNRTATVDELGHRKDFVYDGYGRCKYSSETVGPGDCGTVQTRQTDWIYDRVIELGLDTQATFGATSHTSKEWRIQIEPAFNSAGHRRATARTFDINNRMVSEQTGLIQLPGSPLGTLQTGPDTETRRFTYDENGQKKTFTDARNRVTTYEYDLRNRLKKTIEPLNRVTETSYDPAGNKTQVKFPDLKTQRWENYDAFGQPARFIDERNNPTDLTYQWGPMKKLDTVRTYRSRDDGGTETQLTNFDYDWLGRPSKTCFPDGSDEESTYEFGQLKSFKTRRDQKKIIDDYDARGRETHHYWLNAQNQPDPATPAIERVWDDASRLTRISNIYSIIDYAYDQAGQVRTEGATVTGGGPVREVRYCRYPNGEVSQITYPNGSTVVNRFYTARGQLSSVGWGSGATSYVYHPDGKVDYQPFTNGVTTRYGYDGRGMIQSVSHKNGAGQNLAYREYWRDDRDRILAWKRGVVGPNPMEDGRGDRYAYDEEGQLKMADYRALHPDSTAQAPKRRDVFYYDQLGNRMGSANVIASWGPDAVSFSRENNGLNQYVSWTRGPINQDDDMGSDWGSPGHANGVTMQEGWITASYNALNQPKAIWSPSYPGGALAQYLWFGFDPLGRCVKRWMGSATGHAAGSTPATYYYYDGWDLIQEGPGGTTVARTYVHGSRVDEIVASQAGGEWVYHHYDARGHCILLTNASNGTIREQYDYDAFGFPYFYNASGVKLGSTAQFGNRFLFTGREWLKDLRVYDYRNRIYQPELGRFLQPDPTGFEAGDYNLYRYCHNDPVNKSDPTGLRDADTRLNLTLTGRGDWDFDNGQVAMAQIAAQQRAANPKLGLFSAITGFQKRDHRWKEISPQQVVDTGVSEGREAERLVRGDLRRNPRTGRKYGIERGYSEFVNGKRFDKGGPATGPDNEYNPTVELPIRPNSGAKGLGPRFMGIHAHGPQSGRSFDYKDIPSSEGKLRNSPYISVVTSTKDEGNDVHFHVPRYGTWSTSDGGATFREGD